MQPSRYVKLPFSFDLDRLQRELHQLESAPWIEHFNTQAYESQWSCLPLRSVDGKMDHIMPVENATFQDTAWLQTCPYFRDVIDSFACEKTSVRLMSLAAGGVIKEHRDDGACLEDGITRLHIPIQTTPDVLFRIDGEAVHFSAGDTWYLNASCVHGVVNPGPRARVHLMLDCVSNAWLQEVFAQAGGVTRPAHKYADASITDDNVLDVIAQLRATGHAAGLQMAARLEAMRVPPQA